MAKKDINNPGVLFENPDMEMLHRQLTRMESSLNEKINEVNNRIGTIPQQPTFPASVTAPVEQPPIEVNLPDNLAKSADIQGMTEMLRSVNSTLTATLRGITELRKSIEANVQVDYQKIIEQSSVKAAETVAKKVVDDLSPKIENSTSHALATGALKSPGIGPDDTYAINSRLGRIEDSIAIRDKTEWHKKRFSILLIICIVIADFLFAALWWAFDLKEQRDELIKVEWLYRLYRAITTDPKFTDRTEKEILFGDDKDRDEWKTIIVEREKTATEFRYFIPHDDWQPEPPMPKEEAKPSSDPQTEPEVDFLPHKRKDRMTPGEIEAIKALRANPHIPEDAKPPLPEGY